MHYRTLPHTDLNISTIGLGTWAMGNDFWGSVEDRDSIAAIHAALDVGINFIDTAPAYGAGHAETVVGKAIAGKRDQVVLATKTGVIRTKDRFIRDLSPKNIVKDMEDSLRRLGTEYIDLYQIHWPDANTPLADSMAALIKLKEQGKFRYLGVSNFSVDLIEEARQFSDIVSLQPHFSMLQRKIEAETLPYCMAEQIGLITYGTLAGGLLTGKYRSLPAFSEQDNRSRFYDYLQARSMAFDTGTFTTSGYDFGKPPLYRCSNSHCLGGTAKRNHFGAGWGKTQRTGTVERQGGTH